MIRRQTAGRGLQRMVTNHGKEAKQVGRIAEHGKKAVRDDPKNRQAEKISEKIEGMDDLAFSGNCRHGDLLLFYI